MPQMSPINWLVLFLFFLLMFYILLNIMYFNFLKNKKNNKNKTFKIPKNYNKFI